MSWCTIDGYCEYIEILLCFRNMSKRVRLLVTLAKEKFGKNISPNVLLQDHEVQPTIRLSNPSTSKVPIPENLEENSPVQSNESDYDDFDKDPNFELPGNKTKLSKVKVIPSSSLSSTSNSSSSSSSSSDSSNSNSSSSSSSDSSNSNSDDESIDLSQNPTISGVQEQEPISEEKKGKKRVKKLLMWKTKIAKILRNSGKAYHSLSKSKKQVPERKLRSPCGNNCRMRCNSNFNEPSRHQIFNVFWELADLQRQREFIVGHSQEIKPKYRYSSTQNLRALNTAFYFEINGSKISSSFLA